MSATILRHRWTRQAIEVRLALVFACLALALQVFSALTRVPYTREAMRPFVLEVACWLAPEWVRSRAIDPKTLQPEQCPRPKQPKQ